MLQDVGGYGIEEVEFRQELPEEVGQVPEDLCADDEVCDGFDDSPDPSHPLRALRSLRNALVRGGGHAAHREALVHFLLSGMQPERRHAQLWPTGGEWPSLLTAVDSPSPACYSLGCRLACGAKRCAVAPVATSRALSSLPLAS